MTDANAVMSQDERLHWIERRVCTSFGLDAKAHPLQDTHDEATVASVFNFFKYEDFRCLFVWQETVSKAIIAGTEPPEAPTDTKLLAFRKRPGVLTVSNISAEVLTCECTDEAWEQLWMLSNDIYMPTILFNKDIAMNCTDPRHVFHNLQKFHASIQMTRGHVSGKFLLPDPPNAYEEFQPPTAAKIGKRNSTPRDALQTRGGAGSLTVGPNNGNRATAYSGPRGGSAGVQASARAPSRGTAYRDPNGSMRPVPPSPGASRNTTTYTSRNTVGFDRRASTPGLTRSASGSTS
jgi:hypothetical protein